MDDFRASLSGKNNYLVGMTIGLPIMISFGVLFDMLLITALVAVPYRIFLGYLIKTYNQSLQKSKIKKEYLILFCIGVVLFVCAVVINLVKLQ